MATETLTFMCQVCGSKLTVPVALAGVTGPCPTCQTMIQAPLVTDALAYLRRQSKIAQMLTDGTYRVAYGKAKACTVMLRWNTEDDSNMPYLEAIALSSLDWNP